MDIARGEMVEKELDAMIERRSRQKDPEEASEAWQESVRRYNVRRREENCLAWCDYCFRLAGSLWARTEECDRRAARVRRHISEAKLRQSDARRHMTEHLGRVAVFRRGELDPEEAAEVEVVNAAIRGRLAQIRGEGGR